MIKVIIVILKIIAFISFWFGFCIACNEDPTVNVLHQGLLAIAFLGVVPVGCIRIVEEIEFIEERKKRNEKNRRNK